MGSGATEGDSWDVMVSISAFEFKKLSGIQRLIHIFKPSSRYTKHDGETYGTTRHHSSYSQRQQLPP